MIIMKIMGGFSSQVNKYILGYNLAKILKKELVLDLSDYFDGYFRPYSLCYLEIGSYRIIENIDIINEFKDVFEIRNSQDMEKMFVDNKQKKFWITCEEKDYQDFLNAHKGLEIGLNCLGLEKIKFRKEIPNTFEKKFKETVNGNEAVAVHIRRGDFVTLGWEDDVEYYKAAILMLYEENCHLNFYFFSNDIEWTEKEFGHKKNFFYISSFKGNLGDMEELFCMSHCKYKILSKRSGYGLLANILTFRDGVQGLAVMPYEEDENKKNSNKEKGNIYYLTKRDMVEGKNFEKIFASDKNNNYKNIDSRKLTDQMIDDLGLNVNREICKKKIEILYIRMENYLLHGQKMYARECLEKIENIAKLNMNIVQWEKIYKITKQSKKIYIVTGERKNDWKINGLFLMALILSRVGNEVIYANPNKIQEDSLVEAKNMDGESFPFYLVNARGEYFRRVVEHDGSNSILITDGYAPTAWKQYFGEIYLIKNKKQKLAENVNIVKFKIRHLLWCIDRNIKVYTLARERKKGVKDLDIKSHYDIISLEEMKMLEFIKNMKIIGEKK